MYVIMWQGDLYVKNDYFVLNIDVMTINLH